MRIVDKIGEMLSLSSISLKLLVVLGLLVVVPLLVLGILLIETNQQAIEKTVSENHQKIAVLLAEEIDRFVSTPSQILMTAAQLVGPTGIDFWKQHNILATLALNHPVLERVAFLDTQGMEISSSDLVPQLTHRAGDLAFLRASSGDLYRSELYVSDNDLPFMRVSLPVRYAGQIAGVLLAEVNLRGIWDRVDNIPIGETGSISVVTQEGWIIAHRDKKKVIRGETLALPGLTDRTAGTTALKEREGSGEAWLYTHAFISSLGWNVIVQQSVKEAHASSREMALRSWVLILFSLAATLAVAFALARWIVRPILRLIQGTRRIASGDLSHRIDTRRRDEIGALASSFNEMAASLKQTRDSLQASTTNLVAIFNGITDMLSMIDLGHNIVRANRTVQNVYRMAEKELVGRKCYQVYRNREEPCSECPLQETLATHQRASAVHRDQDRVLQIWIYPITDEQDRLLAAIELVRDITVEEALRQQIVHTGKLAGVGQLAAGIAHQLRNPLGIIRNALYLLDAVLGEGTQDARIYMKKIDSAVRRSQNIIDNLLGFSRPSRHETEQIDIVGLLQQILLLEGKAIEKQDIQIVPDYRPIPSVEANLDSLKDIFLNLVSNAVQAMPRGGTLALSTDLADEHHIKISIRDTGEGISSDTKERIFYPFFSTKDPSKGTGLGLFVVQVVLERIGGTISVDSTPGQGTVFSVILPVHANTPAYYTL